MKSKVRFYKIALFKAWFEKGANLLTYPRYLIYMFLLTTKNMKTMIILGTIYGISCFILGYLAYNTGFATAEMEVGNQYNLFQKQLRNKLKIEKFK